MSLSHRFLVWLFNVVTGTIFRIDDAQLERVPARGPLIIVVNHVNILEIPLIYARMQPRPVHGMVLAERWKNPVFAWGLDTCGTIPLARGDLNLESLRRALNYLKEGAMLIIAPEGTRSGDGRLQAAHPGVVSLALKSMAPLIPVVFYGAEGYKQNLKKLRRTDFHIAVGEPFTLNAGGEMVTRLVRQQMVDEIMYRLAACLPPQYQGEYANPSLWTEKYLGKY